MAPLGPSAALLYCSECKRQWGPLPGPPLHRKQHLVSGREGWMDGNPLPGQVQDSSDLGQQPLEGSSQGGAKK